MKKPKTTPGLQQIVGGPGPTVTADDGTVWQFGMNHQAAKSRLEELVRSHVIREGVRAKRAIGGDEGESHYAAVVAALDRGEYRTLGPGWVNVVLRSDAGVSLFVRSLLQEHHPAVTAADVDALSAAEPEQVAAAVGVVAPDFFRAALRGRNVPPEEVERVVGLLADGLKPQAAGATMPEPATA